MADFPDISVESIDDELAGYEVRADLSSFDTESDELIHRTRGGLPDALQEVGRAVEFASRYDGFDDNPEERGRKAADAIEDIEGVVEAIFCDPPREVWVKTTTFDTERWQELCWAAGLEENWWRLSHDRDHGIVLDIEYSLAEFAPPLTDEQWDELAAKPVDQQPLSMSETTLPAELYHEYRGESEVVRDPDIRDGQPRIAGTTALAYHVYYLREEFGDQFREKVDKVCPELDEDDIEIALAYAEEHEEEAEAYVEQQAYRREQLMETLDED